MGAIVYIKKEAYLFPSYVVLLIFSHIIYYWNILFGKELQLKILVIEAILFLLIGNCFSAVMKPINAKKYDSAYNLNRIKKFGWFCLFIGIAAHIYFYGRNMAYINSYADRYLVTRGNGIFTGLFCGMYTGGSILEYCYFMGEGNKFEKIISRVFLGIYTYFYLFILNKRRQIIILILLLCMIYGKKISLKKKAIAYTGAIICFIFLVIFGQCRSYMLKNGFSGIGSYILSKVSWDWFSPSALEGKYTSRILVDVYHYAEYKGHTFEALLGAFMTLVPRKLLGGNKIENFTSWYTINFYYSDYIKGAGYAGSIVAENYLYGGMAAIAIFYFILGIICSQFYNRLKNDVSKNSVNILIYGFCVYWCLFFPRMDIGSLFVDICFVIIPFKIAERMSGIE